MRTKSPPHDKKTRFIAVAAGLGLATVTFQACGSSKSTTSSSDAATSTDASAVSDASATQDGSTVALTCTASAATAQNTSDVVTAAQALFAKLTAAQQTTISYEYTLANATQWSNLPTTAIARNGVMIGDMTSDAQDAAVALVAVAAGSTGATLFSELRAADEWLVTDGKADSSSYGEGRYYFAFLGTPSTTAPWQLQVAGHHLAYNFTYNGACTSATPLFDGVEPTTWTDTSGTAHAPLESQRAASVAVIGAVSSNADAKLSGTFTDIVNGPTNANGKGDARYPTGLTYPTGTTGRGVLVSSLSSTDQALVKTAIEAWVKNVADPISSALLADYESDTSLAATYVAYSGSTDLTTKNDYFRIDGPRVWIEVTIQGGIVYQNRVHYHTIWRDKESDYGAEFIDATASAGADAGSSGFGGGGGPPDGGGMGGPPDGGMGGPPGN